MPQPPPAVVELSPPLAVDVSESVVPVAVPVLDTVAAVIDVASAVSVPSVVSVVPDELPSVEVGPDSVAVTVAVAVAVVADEFELLLALSSPQAPMVSAKQASEAKLRVECAMPISIFHEYRVT